MRHETTSFICFILFYFIFVSRTRSDPSSELIPSDRLILLGKSIILLSVLWNPCECPQRVPFGLCVPFQRLTVRFQQHFVSFLFCSDGFKDINDHQKKKKTHS